MKDVTVISLGGSLIVPENIDLDFLRDFKNLILDQLKLGKKFLIVTGGGKICRAYQKVAKEIASPSKDDLDWIGIASLRLNAELVRVIFEEYAYPKVIANLSEDFDFEKPIVIGSAYKPGQSTDWDAVLGAIKIGAKKIINLSNIDYVYDSDPKKNPTAKKLENISWSEYRTLIPKDWDPGLNSPFDPRAAEMAEAEQIEVVIMSGKSINNLKNYLDGKDFLGTVIK